MKPCIVAWTKQAIPLLLFAAIACSLCQAQQANAQRKPIAISTHRFQLIAEGKQFYLQSIATEKTQRIAIPRDWLISPQEEKDEEEAPVSSFRFDRHVTSFPIGTGEIGIQLSSYDMMTEGSLGAAEGRDIFLIYDPATGKLRPGKLDLGITKERFHDEGCWTARMMHFIVSDVNENGYADIGTIKEEIRCPEGEDRWEGESYEQHPLHWYLYTPDGWKREEGDSGWPDDYAELPLIGIGISPVDFVAQFLWRSADPSSWKSPPEYLPTYRKKLIADELGRKSRRSFKMEKKK